MNNKEKEMFEVKKTIIRIVFDFYDIGVKKDISTWSVNEVESVFAWILAENL